MTAEVKSVRVQSRHVDDCHKNIGPGCDHRNDGMHKVDNWTLADAMVLQKAFTFFVVSFS